MADRVYLGAAEGLIVLEVDGNRSTPAAQALEGKRITALTLIGDRLYVSAARDGVYTGPSDLQGFHCTLATDPRCLAGRPLNPSILLCGIEPAGLYHSADA